jgi:hypothetical protein
MPVHQTAAKTATKLTQAPQLPVLPPAQDRNENMDTIAAQEKGVQQCWI